MDSLAPSFPPRRQRWLAGRVGLAGLLSIAAMLEGRAAAPLELCTFGAPGRLPIHHEIEIPLDLRAAVSLASLDLPVPERPVFMDLEGLHVRTFEYYAPPGDLMGAYAVRIKKYLPRVPVIWSEEWGRDFPAPEKP